MDHLKIMPDAVVEQLLANGREQEPVKGTTGERDFTPVCKLYLPWTAGTWLVTELAEDRELAFGLADIGFPELGYFSLAEMYEVTGPGGLKLEMDRHFKANKTLSAYAKEARFIGYLKV